MAAKITVKKAAPEEVVLKVDQSRPTLGRFRLQVDRPDQGDLRSLRCRREGRQSHQDGLPGGAGLRL